MRVFVALDIDDAIRERLEQFLDGVARVCARGTMGAS